MKTVVLVLLVCFASLVAVSDGDEKDPGTKVCKPVPGKE